jgi:hypothetical protein
MLSGAPFCSASQGGAGFPLNIIDRDFPPGLHLCQKKAERQTENALAKLWSRRKITKKAHAVHGWTNPHEAQFL